MSLMQLFNVGAEQAPGWPVNLSLRESISCQTLIPEEDSEMKRQKIHTF